VFERILRMVELPRDFCTGCISLLAYGLQALYTMLCQVYADDTVVSLKISLQLLDFLFAAESPSEFVHGASPSRIPVCRA
jgi:hypothetical protein